MEINEKNIKWASDKLGRFKMWPGFPREKEDLSMRIRLFCKMVQNKTAREIFPNVETPTVGADTNDVDWLLDTIAEALEVFPSHAAMRRLYTEYWPTENDNLINQARALASGDVW